MSRFRSFLIRISKLAPVLLALTPLAPIADEVTAAIQEAEAIRGASGPEKLQHVVNIAVEAAKAANEVAGRVLIPLDRVVALATMIVSMIILATNTTEDANA
jgi:hypothetical protein